MALGACANQINALEIAIPALSTTQCIMIRNRRVNPYERKENERFSAIFGDGWQLKWRFSNFPRLRKN